MYYNRKVLNILGFKAQLTGTITEVVIDEVSYKVNETEIIKNYLYYLFIYENENQIRHSRNLSKWEKQQVVRHGY